MRIPSLKILKAILFFVFAFLILSTLSLVSYAQNMDFPINDDFSIPKLVSICDEAVPIEKRPIWEMLDREFTSTVWNRAQVSLWIKRSGRYFPLIEKALEKSDLPMDLKYLAVAESSLLPNIRSYKGAVGTWQFMTTTAERYGLRVDSNIDERRSPQRSTYAAIEYLKDLKEMFGTWTLALAAYNCGEGLLNKQIKRQKITDFYRLNLPQETERFIFRIAAIKIIMETPDRYGYNISKEHLYVPLSYQDVPVRLKTSIPFIDIAHSLNIDYKIIQELNPHVVSPHLPKGRHTLYVPPGLSHKLSDILLQISLNVSGGKSKITTTSLKGK